MCSSRAFSPSLRPTSSPLSPIPELSLAAPLPSFALQEVSQQLVEGGGVLDHDPVPALTEDVHLHVGQTFEQVQAGLQRDDAVVPSVYQEHRVVYTLEC